jgi:hypothetical protein
MPTMKVSTGTTHGGKVRVLRIEVDFGRPVRELATVRQLGWPFPQPGAFWCFDGVIDLRCLAQRIEYDKLEGSRTWIVVGEFCDGPIPAKELPIDVPHAEGTAPLPSVPGQRPTFAN